MWLLTCASNDVAALWARDGLQRRGLEPFEVLTADSLVYETGWEHRIENGHVVTRMLLPNGRRICDREISGVLNRLSIVHPPNLMPIQTSDRYYVSHELQAFFLSWLHALPAPVLNRPTPFGLSGRLRHVSEWIWLATQAGLQTQGYAQSSQDRPLQWDESIRLVDAHTPIVQVMIAGDSVIAPSIPSHIREGCLRLSRLSGAALMGIDLAATTDHSWIFAGVSTRPDLRNGGEPLLDALAGAFTGSREAK